MPFPSQVVPPAWIPWPSGCHKPQALWSGLFRQPPPLQYTHTHTHPPLVSSHQGEISSPDQVMLLCVLGLAAATGDPKDCSYCPSTHTASSSSPKSPLTLAHACKRHRARLPSLLWVCLLSQLVCDTLEDRDSVLLTQPPELGTRKVLSQMWELDHKEGLNAEELMLLNCRAGKDSWGSLWWQGD